MPSSVTDEKFEAICQGLEMSREGLRHFCEMHGVTRPAFYDLIEKDSEKADRYTRAKERQADYLAELILDVAFDDKDDEKDFVGVNHIQRDRLKVDSLKFIASKLKPKVYGDKLDLTTGGKEIKSIPLVLSDGRSYDDLKNELKPE